MKIITASENWNLDKVYQFLKLNLNTRFRDARQVDWDLIIVNTGDAIEITQPQLYDGYLFRLTAEGQQLYMAKSEHYVDDVNQLTLQAMLETLQMEYLDGANIKYISGE